MSESSRLTEVGITEAAARVHRSEWTLRKWIRDGRVHARKSLGRVLVDVESLDALLAGEPLGAAQDTSPAHPTPEGRP